MTAPAPSGTLNHPIICQHPILRSLSDLSHDFARFDHFRSRVRLATSPVACVQMMVDENMCTEDHLQLIRNVYSPSGILPEMTAKFLSAMEQVGPHGPYLSAWTVMGASAHADVTWSLSHHTIMTFVMTPHMQVAAKLLNRTDPGFVAELQNQQTSINQFFAAGPV